MPSACHVFEQFVDELLVFAGEGAAVEGAAEVPVGGVQNLHGFSMALRHVLRLAVRHSGVGTHHCVGAHAERGLRPQGAPAPQRGHSPASMSTKPPGTSSSRKREHKAAWYTPTPRA